MASSCFWCASSAPGHVPSPVGNPGEPIGCCIKCQVFSCGHHAIRNSFRQEFKCFDCLVVTLINTGADNANLSTADRRQLQNSDPTIIVQDTGSRPYRKYKDFSEFELQTPELKQWFPTIREIEIDWSKFPKPLYQVLQKLGPDDLLFLKAAAFILYEMTGNDFPANEDNPLRKALLNSIKINSYTL